MGTGTCVGVGAGPEGVCGVMGGVDNSGTCEGIVLSRGNSFVASAASLRRGGLAVPMGGDVEEEALAGVPSFFKSLAPVEDACALVMVAGLLSVLTSILFFGILGS